MYVGLIVFFDHLKQGFEWQNRCFPIMKVYCHDF